MNWTSRIIIVLSLAAIGTAALIETVNASIEDSVPWSEQSSGTSADLNGVVWGGGQFVAVGDQGAIVTSPDGETWTARVSGTSADLLDVTWNGLLFVAVGVDVIISSNDGSEWTFRSATGGASSLLSSVAWGNGTFIAVGKRNDASAGLTMTSGDGIIWTGSDEPSDIPLGVDFAGSHFFRCHDGEVFRSGDGFAWESVLDRPGTEFSAVTRSASAYIAVGDEICSSMNGAEWNCQETVLGPFLGVADSGAGFVAAGSSMATSEDGSDWVGSLAAQGQAVASSGLETVIVGPQGTIYLGDTTSIFFDDFESAGLTHWSEVNPTLTPTPTGTPTPSPTPTPIPCEFRIVDLNPNYGAFRYRMHAQIFKDMAYAARLTRTYFDWGDGMEATTYMQWMGLCADPPPNDYCDSIEYYWDDNTGTIDPPTGRYARPLDVSYPYPGMYLDPIMAPSTTDRRWWAQLSTPDDPWDGEYEVCFEFSLDPNGFGTYDYQCPAICASITAGDGPTPTPTATPGPS